MVNVDIHNPSDVESNHNKLKEVLNSLENYKDDFVGPDEDALIKATYELEKPLSTLEMYNVKKDDMNEIMSILSKIFYTDKYSYKLTQPETYDRLVKEGDIDEDKFNGQIVVSRFSSVIDVFMKTKPQNKPEMCAFNALLMWPSGPNKNGKLDLEEVAEYCAKHGEDIKGVAERTQ